MAQKLTELKTHFKKTEYYKSSFVTGIFGGLTTQGLIHMNYFIDRPVIPKSIVYRVDEPSRTLKEVERDQLEGIVREVDGAILFDVNIAKQMIVWIQSKIDELEALPKP